MITKMVHPAATIVQLIASFDDMAKALKEAAAIVQWAGPLNIYELNVSTVGGVVHITISAPQSLVNFSKFIDDQADGDQAAGEGFDEGHP